MPNDSVVMDVKENHFTQSLNIEIPALVGAEVENHVKGFRIDESYTHK